MESHGVREHGTRVASLRLEHVGSRCVPRARHPTDSVRSPRFSPSVDRRGVRPQLRTALVGADAAAPHRPRTAARALPWPREPVNVQRPTSSSRSSAPSCAAQRAGPEDHGGGGDPRKRDGRGHRPPPGQSAGDANRNAARSSRCGCPSACSSSSPDFSGSTLPQEPLQTERPSRNQALAGTAGDRGPRSAYSTAATAAPSSSPPKTIDPILPARIAGFFHTHLSGFHTE